MLAAHASGLFLLSGNELKGATLCCVCVATAGAGPCTEMYLEIYCRVGQ